MNKLDAAFEHFQQGFEIAEKWGVLDLVKAYVCQYRIQLAHGDLQGALEALEKAISLAKKLDQDFRGGVARALRTRLWLLQGEFDKANHWFQHEFEYDPLDPSELNEIRGITQARVLLALGNITGCLDLLEMLLTNAENTQRLGHAIEIRIIKALALDKNQDSNLALIELKQALGLAEPHGFMRIFLDEGPEMEALITKVLHTLASITERRVSTAYLHNLLSAFGVSTPAQDQTLVEELSPRELEILQLIAIGLSNREISERLFLAINTIKGYNHTIFGKLGVQNRTEAANRARELGIA
jgi:LuxR family maltose regulon positive regulatory protein